MAAEEPSMVCGRTGALMTATLVTGGVDGGAYRDPPPKFTFTDTRLNNGLRLIVAAAPILHKKIEDVREAGATAGGQPATDGLYLARYCQRMERCGDGC
jgi:hypothetical protein